MIIIGYPGIGKSELAGQNNIIDLDSEEFKKNKEFVSMNKNPYYMLGDVESVRPQDWYVYYCQMAESLSKQGYTVFVSSHAEVREYLRQCSKEPLSIIFPEKALKLPWINKLEERCEKNKSEKNLETLSYVRKNYDTDVSQMWYECQYGVEYYNDVRLLSDTGYNLLDIVNDLLSGKQKSILSCLRRMKKSYFADKSEIDIYNFICDSFCSKNKDYATARECTTIWIKELRQSV